MNLNDLANLGQIVGAIGVMITLVYLAIQIRGSRASSPLLLDRGENGAAGRRDMGGKAARAAVERCGSTRDTTEVRVEPM